MDEEVHGASGLVGAEIARLDACEVDISFWVKLVEKGFGGAFDGLFGGAVDIEHWHSSLASGRGELLDPPAAGLLIPHGLHSHPRNVDQAEEIDFLLCPDLAI